MIHTGNRVDGVLGAAVFRHLLALPLRYFERRPTGVLTARLAGIETIREFLTGAAVALALDVPFLLVFLVVMLLYSVPLTLLTLAVVALLGGRLRASRRRCCRSATTRSSWPRRAVRRSLPSTSRPSRR